MSSFLKRFGGGGKEKEKKPSKTTPERAQSHAQPHAQNGASPEEEAKYAAATGNGRRERNLSISRSGKHKMKNKQRTSVMEGVFDGPQSSTQESSASQGQINGFTSRTAGAGGPHCRDEKQRPPRQAMTTAPTAV